MRTSEESLDELARLYADLDDEMSELGWQCRRCSDCCRFAEFGHELFCSALEAELLAGTPGVDAEVADEVCPFLAGVGCTRHERRTISCRTFFCDASDDSRMSEVTERFVTRLKALHERFGVAWDYARLTDHLKRRKLLQDKA